MKKQRTTINQRRKRSYCSRLKDSRFIADVFILNQRAHSKRNKATNLFITDLAEVKGHYSLLLMPCKRGVLFPRQESVKQVVANIEGEQGKNGGIKVKKELKAKMSCCGRPFISSLEGCNNAKKHLDGFVTVQKNSRA